MNEILEELQPELGLVPVQLSFQDDLGDCEPLESDDHFHTSYPDFWEPDKFDSQEPRVKLGTNPNLPLLETELKEPDLEYFIAFWKMKEQTLTLVQIRQVIDTLNSHQNVFSKDEFDLGHFPKWKHKIDTGNHPPIKSKPRKLSHEKKLCLKEIIAGLKRANLIRDSRSDWASCIVMVKKQNGAWRMCMDYRPLNLLATCCQFPLPRISDILQALSGSSFFTALDLMKGFHQIPLDEDSIPKTAFVTPIGQFEYLTIPMGLHSAPAAFQAAMQEVLTGCESFALVYIDDIIIFSKTFADHVKHVGIVFLRLFEFNLKANRDKCEFFRSELTYLGHVINSNGIHTDPRKTSAVKDMPEPKCIMEVETFLGKVGYYQKFIPDFSEIAYPLMQMKRKDATFKFEAPQREAFEKLKDALCSAPVLKHPDFERPFFISTDASGFGLGAILFQKYGPDLLDEYPVSYISRTLKGPELRYSATEREAMAVWWACDQFLDYIDGRQVTVYSDHKALLAMPIKAMNNRRLQLIAHKLTEFQYTIEYRPGKIHTNADALSRYPIVECKGRRSKEIQTNESSTNGFDPLSNLALDSPKFKRKIPDKIVSEIVTEKISEDSPISRPKVKGLKEKIKIQAMTTVSLSPADRKQVEAWLADIINLQKQVPIFRALIKYLTEDDLPVAVTTLRVDILRIIEYFYINDDGILCRASKEGALICLPPQLHEAAIHDAHSVPASGHYGQAKTLFRVQESYYWPGMSKNIAEFIQKCPMCLAHKAMSRIPRENLGNRPPPTDTFQRVHMDIWGPSGYSNRSNRYVLAFVDAFSKYVIFVPIAKQTTEVIIEVIINEVIMPFGAPDEIFSDSAANFKAAILEDLVRIFGVLRKTSTPYNPMSNGQVERIFKTIRPILASLAFHSPKDWDLYLPMAAHSYNTSYHASIKTTPFKIMFGRNPVPLADRHDEIAKKGNEDRLLRWNHAIHAAQEGLLSAQERSRDFYDLRAHPREIKVGDEVLVKIPKAPRSAVHKLYPRYVGPYHVIKSLDKVIYVEPVHGRLPRGRELRIHKNRVKICDTNYPNIHTFKDLMHPFESEETYDTLEAEAPD